MSAIGTATTGVYFIERNILNLEHPHDYACRVLWYHAAYRNMVLEIRNRVKGNANILYVQFAGVQAYDGPLEWRGANIHIQTAEQSPLWFNRVLPQGRLGKQAYAQLKTVGKIFVIETLFFSIRICALGFDVSHDMPQFKAI